MAGYDVACGYLSFAQKWKELKEEPTGTKKPTVILLSCCFAVGEKFPKGVGNMIVYWLKMGNATCDETQSPHVKYNETALLKSMWMALDGQSHDF